MYKNVLLLLIVVPSFFYAQKDIEIEFNIIDKVALNDGFATKDKLSVIKANVETKYGRFSLLLIDYNKNNLFNDFGNKYGIVSSLLSISKKPDGIRIGMYGLEKEKPLSDGGVNTLLKATEFLFNGYLFTLKNLKKTSKYKYTARINIVNDKEIDYKKGYNDYYLNYSDRISNICLKNLNNDKEFNMVKLLTKKKLFVQYIYAELNLYNITNSIVNYIESYTPKNMNIIYVFVDSSKEEIESYVNIRKLKFKTYYIDVKDYKSIMSTGFTFFPEGVLYNKQGKIVSFEYDMTLKKLQSYDN
jgi:hypothetical protein